MHTCPVLYIALPYSIASQILLHIVIPYCILHCFILYSVRGGAELRWALSFMSNLGHFSAVGRVPLEYTRSTGGIHVLQSGCDARPEYTCRDAYFMYSVCILSSPHSCQSTSGVHSEYVLSTCTPAETQQSTPKYIGVHSPCGVHRVQ